MNFLSVIVLSISFSTVGISESDIEKIELKNGVALLIAEASHSRTMPWAFYDQAIESIPGIYPNSDIVVAERLGFTGDNNEVIYSIVGYKEFGDSTEVFVRGIATVNLRAWTFDLQVKEAILAQTLQLVLQELEKLPYNKRMQSHLQKATSDAKHYVKLTN